jgi:outer membrane lipoprotein SlyB
MKTKLKLLMLFLTLSLNNAIFAQNENKSYNLFVSVYNLEGKKINNGKIISVSDTLLNLKNNNKIALLNVKDVGLIKTKRSAGNNVLVGSLIGAVAGGGIGAASAEPDTIVFNYSAGEGALAGGILGGATGAGIGGLTALLKKSKTFIINGDTSKWKLFIESISN